MSLPSSSILGFARPFKSENILKFNCCCKNLVYSICVPVDCEHQILTCESECEKESMNIYLNVEYFKARHRLPFLNTAGVRGGEKKACLLFHHWLQVRISPVIQWNAAVTLSGHCIRRGHVAHSGNFGSKFFSSFFFFFSQSSLRRSGSPFHLS